MHTEHHLQAIAGADPEALDDQVAGMHRDWATEEPRPSPRRTHPAGEVPGHRPLCAHGMNSLTDKGYRLAVARLRRG